MKEELDALTKNHTWNLVTLPLGQSVVGCKWIYKIKTRSNGSVERYKAYLVMDVKNAFLNGDLSEEVYMQPPFGLSVKSNKVSQYLFAPQSTHYATILRILRYLKGTLFHDLFCPAQSPLVLRAFSNTDWVGDPTDRSLKFNSSQSSKLVSWDSSTDCCSWTGVTCNMGHVIGLELVNESILGGLDNSSSLFNLHYLESLNLAENSFYDTQIPSGFENLVNLIYLNLSNSDFVGQIPVGISSLIRPYSFFSCNASVTLSDTFGHEQSIYFSSRIFANFSNLSSLHVSSCNLHARFPKNIFQVTTLQTLDISENQLLNGVLPVLPENSSLQNLLLSHTNLSRPLPHSITNLKSNPIVYIVKKLVNLNLAHNFLTGSILSTDWEALQNLRNIELNNNSFSRCTPLALFNIPELQKIILSNNQFSGLVGKFSNMAPGLLNTLDLSSNNFEGPIPMFFFQFSSLSVLSLSSNRFGGTFELSILKNLPNLTVLELSFNNLSSGASWSDSTGFMLPQLTNLRLAHCKL
ncbi:receptor-like protein 7 [Quercus lobata]|uniref:receptor-like protein 7 n=1 Tax=Quercus lobata TaxID=97700 RepID=UPI001243EB23|nr:receptor-like protein 7 [Quercus lobata]